MGLVRYILYMNTVNQLCLKLCNGDVQVIWCAFIEYVMCTIKYNTGISCDNQMFVIVQLNSIIKYGQPCGGIINISYHGSYSSFLFT